MVYSLLFSLPGHAGAVLRRGDRHGRGARAEGRHAVRTTMQWTAGRNGGFSDAPPSRLAAPTVEGGFGPEHVNVEAQRRDPDSLLRFVTLLVQRYREAPELGWGELEVLDQPHQAVLAHRPHPRRRHHGRACTTSRPRPAVCPCGSRRHRRGPARRPARRRDDRPRRGGSGRVRPGRVRLPLAASPDALGPATRLLVDGTSHADRTATRPSSQSRCSEAGIVTVHAATVLPRPPRRRPSATLADPPLNGSELSERRMTGAATPRLARGRRGQRLHMLVVLARLLAMFGEGLQWPTEPEVDGEGCA